MNPSRILRGTCDQRGATLVGFALTFPVLMATVATGLFANHAYAVKSDLQRTAQEAARYASTRCDPRGAYTSGGCQSGKSYPTTADVGQYITAKFTGHSPAVTFANDCAGSASDATPGLFCKQLDPSTTTDPVPNQRLTVTLQYRFSSPFDRLLKIMPGASGLLNLKVAGDAVVE